MKKLLQKVLNLWPIWVLVLVESALFAANYKSGTYLIGWDNLFPEFNFGLNLKRGLVSVWQEYRGLGTLDGMSHAANLPHTVFMWLLSWFLPQNMLRYAFVFLMHLVGGAGMYLLLKDLLGKGERRVLALAGSLFYQYNLATIQIFSLPFELFLVHFAFLPWLVWSVTKYLRTGGKKALAVFGLVSLLSVPQAHVPTVFLVYLAVLGVFLASHLAGNLKDWLRVVKVLLVTLVVNAFWLLPFLYGVAAGKPEVITSSKNNQMATDDIFFRNHEFGDFESTALMRSFALKFIQYDFRAENHDFMLPVWREWVNESSVENIAWGFFGLAVLGLVAVLVSRKRQLVPYLVLFGLVFLIVGNDIPYLENFSLLLRERVPLFHTLFRFVFTKFFVLYAFLYSVMVFLALEFVGRWVPKSMKKLSALVLSGVMIGLLGYYSLPVFRGEFFHDNLRVEIPGEYFETFDFFGKQDPNKRVAMLPAPWFWAWTQYDWGAIGSGFTWFGIEQPILDRAFDPWSGENENFYWELNRALYGQDVELLESVLEKYQVEWLLADDNVINPSFPGSLYLDEFVGMVEKSNKISLAEEFGDVAVYRVTLESEPKSFVYMASDLPRVGPEYGFGDYDKAFLDLGSYVSDNGFGSYYPFRSLFTGKNQENLEFEVTEGEEVAFRADLPESVGGKMLRVDGEFEESVVRVDGKELAFDTNGESKLERGSKELEVVVSKNEALVYDSDRAQLLPRMLPKACDLHDQGESSHRIVDEHALGRLRLETVGGAYCVGFGLSSLVQDQGYLVVVEYKNIEGRGLELSVINKDWNKPEIEVLLPTRKELGKSYFVLNPGRVGAKGYSVHFNNLSFGREATVNELRRVSFYKIPFELLSSLVVGDVGSAGEVRSNVSLEVDHTIPSRYKVKIDGLEGGETLVLSQGYENGWMAFASSRDSLGTLGLVKAWLFGQELEPFGNAQGLRHVKVNSWSNGWRVPGGANQIVMVYWPQYLQWIGLLVLGAGGLYGLVNLRRGESV